MQKIRMKLMLGKKPARFDKRDLKFADILRDLPPIPESFNFDTAHPEVSIPTPIFGNDRYGDCVEAAQAHQTLRFEVVEQKKVISITSGQVVADYFKNYKPKSKVLILDANQDVVSKGALFKKAWAELYPGIIEYRASHTVVRVDGQSKT